MRLFHFVKEHHRVRPAANRFGKLAAFLIAHVSGRCANEPGHGEFLHVFGHINAHDVLFIVKQGFRQRLGQLRLAHARGAQEQEGANGPVFIRHTGTGAQNGFADRRDCFVLADYPLMKHLGQPQQLLPLAFHQLAHRNARPPGHNPGDLLLGDLIPQQRGLVGAFLFGLGQFFLQLGQLAIFQFGRPGQIIFALGLLDLGIHLLDFLAQLLHLANFVLFVFPAGLHLVELLAHVAQFLMDDVQPLLGQGIGFLLQGRFLYFVLHNPAADVVQLSGHGIHFRADHGAGFVHQVNSLVGQETIGDIAVGQGGGGDQRAILNLHAVEHLIAFLQAAQDGDSILHRGLIHHHRLEPALQSRVLFHVLAVFVQSGGADAVQLAPSQHGLEQIARVHGALGFARTHDSMQLINKEDDLAFALFDLRQHGLEPLFKFAPEFRAGNQRAHVQRKHGAILQGIGHVAADDPQRQPFGNGGFAHAGLADQHGVVFRLSGQDANHVSDFAVSANHRIQLPLPGLLHQIGAVFGQRVVGILRALAGHPGRAAHSGQGA